MKSVAIQQTLHGYSEGHRLLDGSVKFADELARIVLRMSDLSGSNVVSGFEEYLTGYPLEAVNLYALAKTWYASEMPRPGCVWTHTLFISVSDMADIPDLQALTGLFLRPQNPKTFAGYSKAIQFETKQTQTRSSISSNGTGIQVADLVETLYNQNKDYVLIGAQNSRAYESAIFRVWSQQWPELRKAFSFCTGALSTRGFNGKPFDVQCTPISLVRDMTAASAAKHSQEISLLAEAEPQGPSWLVSAIKDALNPVGETFRQLLWEFADAPNRKCYAQFAQLIDKLSTSSSRPPTELVEMVGELFPNVNLGSRLKTALFGGKISCNGISQFDEGELLAALASTEHFEAFSSEGLQLKNRGRDLCHLAPQSAQRTISKLFRSSINQLGKDVLAGMIEGINPEIAREITTEQPQFLPALFRAKPELAISPDLWEAAGDRKRELFESVAAHEKLDDELVMGIAQAILESNSEPFVRRALDRWGKAAVFGTLDWVAKHDGKMSEVCLGALTFHVQSVMDWVEAMPNRPLKTLVATAHVVAPYSYQICQRDTGVWLRVLHDLQSHNVEREAVYISAFVLALALKNAPPAPLTLISECFERVHKTAWNDALPDDAWVILDPIVPHLWWPNDWDKCERLRRGLIQALVQYRWPTLPLVQCIPNQELLKQVVKSASKVDGGTEALRSIG